MNNTMDTGEPSYATGDSQKSIAFDVGLSFAVLALFLIITVCYTFYFYKRSPSPPPPPPTNDSDTDDYYYHSTKLSSRLDDDVLVTFPTFLYSEAVVVVPHKVDIETNTHGSACSICLVDYTTAEVLRSLPECGHFFHVKCIDTWLKVHLTCPVCRRSPLPTPSTCP